MLSDKQKLLFQHLKEIKDYWVDVSVESISSPDTDLMWSEYEEEHRLLQKKFTNEEEISAFRKVQEETFRGLIHSILVMIDGGDHLCAEFTMDLIDEETKESLKENIELHDEFYGYLLDVEEE
jgi:hypothetical protein